MGTPTGIPYGVPVPPKPTVTTCQCGAAYTGHKGDEWLAEHVKKEHPPSAADSASKLEKIHEIISAAVDSHDYKGAVKSLAEFLEISV